MLNTHCWEHTFNLAVVRDMKQCRVHSDALDIAFEIFKLIKFSPRHNAALDRIESESTDEDFPAVVDIRKLCPTRWTIRVGLSAASLATCLKTAVG